jgi:hypothetical protein
VRDLLASHKLQFTIDNSVLLDAVMVQTDHNDDNDDWTPLMALGLKSSEGADRYFRIKGSTTQSSSNYFSVKQWQAISSALDARFVDYRVAFLSAAIDDASLLARVRLSTGNDWGMVDDRL